MKHLNDRYRLVKSLGKGGFGEVFLADDLNLFRQVAIKVSSAKVENLEQEKRFKREAELLAKFNHSNIPAVYDYGKTEDGRQYLVMELIKGHTLQEVLRAGALPLPRCLEVTAAIARALEEAHGYDIIHRDIKPGNVMLTFTGGIKVLDFGLAKQLKTEVSLDADTLEKPLAASLTITGIVMGTAQYMSPEQATGKGATKQSDLFSLGAVLYECLTGEAAFSGSTLREVLQQVVFVHPLPPSVIKPELSVELDRITRKALAKKPAERYQTANEFLAELRAIQVEPGSVVKPNPKIADLTRTEIIPVFAAPRTSDSAPANSVPPPRPRTKFHYRHWAIVAAILFVLLSAYVSWRVWVATPDVLMPSSPVARAAYQQGIDALHVGAYHAARKHLEKVVNNDPNFVPAHTRLAEAWFELDFVERAKDEILVSEKLLREHQIIGSLDERHLRSLHNLISPLQAEAAVIIYREMINLVPAAELWAAENDLGRAYEKLDDIPHATTAYLASLRLNARNPRALTRLAILYGRSGDSNQANQYFTQAENMCRAVSNEGARAEGNEALAEVLYQRGVWFMMREQLNEARLQLLRAQKENDPQNVYLEIKTLLKLCNLESRNLPLAEQYAESALKLMQSNPVYSLPAQVKLELGDAYFDNEKDPEAKRLYEEALELATRYRQPRLAARARLSLANLYIGQDDKLGLASEKVREAISFYKDGGYRSEQAKAEHMLGEISEAQGDYDAARQSYQRELDLAQQANLPALKATAHIGLGQISEKQGHYPAARDHFQQSYDQHKQLSDHVKILYSLLQLSETLVQLGDYADARKNLDLAAVEMDALGDRAAGRRGWFFLLKTRLLFGEQQLTAAAEEGRQALKLAEKSFENHTGSQTEVIEARYTLGLVRTYAGEQRDGIALCKQAVKEAQQLNDPLTEAQARLAFAEALFISNNWQASRTEALRAQGSFASFRNQAAEWRAWLFAMMAAQRLGNPRSCNECGAQARTIFAQQTRDWQVADKMHYTNKPDTKAYFAQLGEISNDTQQK